MTVPVIVATTFCARDFRSPCPLRPMGPAFFNLWYAKHLISMTMTTSSWRLYNPCPCIYCPYTSNTPRPMIIQSMTLMMRWSWVPLFWHCYFDEPSLLPVLLGLVKEIALYITAVVLTWLGLGHMTLIRFTVANLFFVRVRSWIFTFFGFPKGCFQWLLPCTNGHIKSFEKKNENKRMIMKNKIESSRIKEVLIQRKS